MSEPSDYQRRIYEGIKQLRDRAVYKRGVEKAAGKHGEGCDCPGCVAETIAYLDPESFAI